MAVRPARHSAEAGSLPVTVVTDVSELTVSAHRLHVALPLLTAGGPEVTCPGSPEVTSLGAWRSRPWEVEAGLGPRPLTSSPSDLSPGGSAYLVTLVSCTSDQPARSKNAAPPSGGDGAG